MIAALIGSGILLFQWQQAEGVRSRRQANIAAQFAELSPQQVEGMKAKNPEGPFGVRTSGTYSGQLVFGGDENNPTVSGSVSMTGLSPREGFAATIPAQSFSSRQRPDGSRVAHLKGIFYWYDSSNERATSSDLPVELQTEAEELEMQLRRQHSLGRRIDALPWNATNVDKVRPQLMEELRTLMLATQHTEAHLEKVAIKAGLPGIPSYITREAELTYKWGSTPTLQAPSPVPAETRVELDPVR